MKPMHHVHSSALGVAGMVLGGLAWACGTMNHFIAPMRIPVTSLVAAMPPKSLSPEELTAWLTAISGGITAFSGAVVVAAGAVLKIHGMWVESRRRPRRKNHESEEQEPH